jgi:hypothetical protein
MSYRLHGDSVAGFRTVDSEFLTDRAVDLGNIRRKDYGGMSQVFCSHLELPAELSFPLPDLLHANTLRFLADL